MVLGFGGGGGEGVRIVCPGGDSGLEPAGRKGANPTGYSVKCFVRLGVTSEALGQGAAVLGEQVERILIPLAGSDCFKRVTLLPGTKDRDRKTGRRLLPQCGQDRDGQPAKHSSNLAGVSPPVFKC